MALHLIDAPAEALELVRTHVPTRPLAKMMALTEQSRVDVEVSRAYRLYTVTLMPFLKDTLLDSARFTAWLYIVLHGEDTLGTMEVTDDQGRLSYSGLYQGTHAQRLLEALAFAEQQPFVRRRDYEARLLQAPALYFFAVWLHSSDHNALIPVGAPVQGLHAHVVYSEREITDALRSLAIERATTSDEDVENGA